MSDEYITIPELTEVDSLNTDDSFLLSRSGEEKKIKLKSELDKKLDNTTSPDNAGKVVGVDEDGSLIFVEGGGGGGSALVPDITQAEYDELTPEEQNNGQIRHITDAPETPVPFAVVNDGLMSSANVLTASKTLHLPTVVINANADATKTIDAYYQNNGASVKVLLLNGHSGSTFTINGKTVYVNKDGQAVAVPSHTINSVDWFVQAYTTLELIYLSSLDDGNGGWLVVGNPVVLSGSVVNGNNTSTYEVKANGFIEQRLICMDSSSDKVYTLPVSFSDTSYTLHSMWRAPSVQYGDYAVGYIISASQIQLANFNGVNSRQGAIKNSVILKGY